MHHKLERGLDRALLVAGASLVVATLIVLVTTGGAGGAGGQTDATVDNVAITDFKFLPANITVPVGEKITWTNSDSAPHTATSGTGSSVDGTFDTGTIEQDGSASVRVKEPGTFAYYCRFHAFMKGTVTVR